MTGGVTEFLLGVRVPCDPVFSQ